MFWFLKNGQVFYSELITSLRGTKSFSTVINSVTATEFGLFYPITEKASNLLDYFTYGKEALFIPEDEAHTAILIGCNRRVHSIRAEMTDKKIDVRVSTQYFQKNEVEKDKQILVAETLSIEESLRPFVFGNYTIPQTIKALDTLSFYAGSKELRSPGWEKGYPLEKLLKTTLGANPLLNPDYKE